jgi:pimeloyl-ACP methyl ester carboxylesterase
MPLAMFRFPIPRVRLAWLTAMSINATAQVPVEAHRLASGIGELTMHLGVQQPDAGGPPAARGDVLYVHGATFSSDLSVFFRFGGSSWADALNAAGFRVWGLDFVGYGRSERQAAKAADAPLGRSDSAAQQLQRAVQYIRSRNGQRPVHLIAHSWGSIPALRYATQEPASIGRIVLFGPIVQRQEVIEIPAMGPNRPVNIWEQYRRFIEDVPKGEPALIDDGDMARWARDWLATDPSSSMRNPPSVMAPNGPVVDFLSLWSGGPAYDAIKVKAPVLLVRGEWDSYCNDDDAQRLLAQLPNPGSQDQKITKGTHLMHLERSRAQLHEASRRFLLQP